MKTFLCNRLHYLVDNKAIYMKCEETHYPVLIKTQNRLDVQTYNHAIFDFTSMPSFFFLYTNAKTCTKRLLRNIKTQSVLNNPNQVIRIVKMAC